jgi:hypothetical protein
MSKEPLENARHVTVEWPPLNEAAAASSAEALAVARRVIKDHLMAFKELAK